MGLFDFLRNKKQNVSDEPSDNQPIEDDVVFFPDLSFVFKENTETLKNMFFPALSIRLSSINKDWGNGFIHLIQFNEDPYNRDTVKYYNEYCKDNTISFTLDDGKYTFNTDLRFLEVTEDWKKYLEETKTAYLNSKAKYESTGQAFNLADFQLSGKPGWWQRDSTPIDPDGNPMTFITEMETYPFCPDSCDKKIFLFYSHKHKLVVQLYQST
jgi:hypothetical protein